MIPPARANTYRARGDRHRHVETGVADDDARVRRSAGISDGLLDHRRMRLGRVTVRRLERNEPRVDAMLVKAMPEAAVRFPRCNREQPAASFESIEQLHDSVEHRLLDLAGRPQLPELALIILGQREML